MVCTVGENFFENDKCRQRSLSYIVFKRQHDYLEDEDYFLFDVSVCVCKCVCVSACENCECVCTHVCVCVCGREREKNHDSGIKTRGYKKDYALARI